MSLRKVGVHTFFDSKIATFTSAGIDPWHTNRTFEAYGTTSAGSGSATIIIEVRNSDNADWKTLATITLTLGTAVAGDGFSSTAAWNQVRARMSAISGTNATVTCNIGSAPL